jgi:hypothetical protein
MPQLQDDPNPLAIDGDAIAPYLSDDGQTFKSDYWVRGRVGAMAGALVSDYNRARFSTGPFIGPIEGGRRPAETFVVVSPSYAVLGNSRVRTSGDVGWDENARGRWNTIGYPQGYVDESWTRGRERETRPGWPSSVRRGGRR